jgi:heat shock protein HslJ
VAVAVVAGALLAACGPTGAGAPSADDNPGELQGRWQLTSMSVDGADLPAPAGAGGSLELDDSVAQGVGGCNSYVTVYVASGSGTWGINDLGVSEMACLEPLDQWEASYLGAFKQVSHWSLDGQDLVLIGPGIVLEYHRS